MLSGFAYHINESFNYVSPHVKVTIEQFYCLHVYANKYNEVVVLQILFACYNNYYNHFRKLR